MSNISSLQWMFDMNLTCFLLFVCLFNLCCPSQHFFSHVGTEPPLSGYYHYFSGSKCVLHGGGRYRPPAPSLRSQAYFCDETNRLNAAVDTIIAFLRAFQESLSACSECFVESKRGRGECFGKGQLMICFLQIHIKCYESIRSFLY